MDGVLVNFVEPLCLWLNIKPEDIRVYSLQELFPNRKIEIENFITQKNYFKDLKPYIGAIDFVENLMKLKNAQVWLVSTPMIKYSITWSDKIEWIINYLPKLLDKTILTKDKSLVNLDIFIEDSPENLEKHNAKYKFLIDQPWNQQDKKNKRIFSYNDLLNEIKKIVKE